MTITEGAPGATDLAADGRVARELVDAVRRLSDVLVRVRPTVAAAGLADELNRITDALADRADPGRPAGPGLDPWYLNLPRPDRADLLGSADAGVGGALWARFNPLGLPLELRVERTSEGGVELAGRTLLSTVYGGPPGRVHGGVLALVMDYAMGAAVHVMGRPSYTAQLDTTFLGGTPLGAELQVRAGRERVEGRKTWMWATISVDGVETVRGRGLFLTVAR